MFYSETLCLSNLLNLYSKLHIDVAKVWQFLYDAYNAYEV